MTASPRTVVLDRIRSALDSRPNAPGGASPAQWRAAPPAWTRPAQQGELTARFTARAEANFCMVHRVGAMDAVGATVETILQDCGLPRDVSIAPALQRLPWPGHWTTNFGAGRRVEAVAITDALAGISETGSLVVCSDASRPAGLNFLPELHVAVLRCADIVPHQEDAWPKVRALPVWPRAISIISAPSRTADVAQIVVRPAHGPKALHVILVEAA